MNESQLQRRALIDLSDVACLWRNNVGVATQEHGMIRYGVGGKGGADLIGLRRADGRFIAIELKVGKRQPTPEQKQYLDCVRGAGGIAIVGRSVDQIREEIERG